MSRIEPRHRASLIRNLLLAFFVLSLILGLSAYKKGPVLKAAWKKAMLEETPLNPPQRPAASMVAASSVAGAAVPPNPAAGSSVSPEDQAQRIWSDFEKTSWNETLETWSGQHRDVACKAFRGNMWSRGADSQWSHQCAAGERPEEARWSFYVFGLQEPLIPRLEQFEESSPTLPEEALKTLQNSLVSLLAMRFGPGEDRSQKPLSAHAFWWPQMHWQNGDVEIQLFASEFDPQRKQGRLRLLAQHRTLLEALTEDDRLRLVGGTPLWYEVGSAIDKQLADELKPEFPNVAVMLVKQQPDPDPQKEREALEQFQRQLRARASQGGQQMGVGAALIAMPQTNWKATEFYDELVKLLTSAKAASPARRPILLWAADRLASRLPWVIENDKSHEGDWKEWREQLATYGITYQPGPEEPWAYGNELLKRIWTDDGETEWGERAFLFLLSRGWDTGCANGADTFRKMIDPGLQFLEKHPNSPYRLDVQVLVAQAYETWWSLSQAPTGQDVPEGEADVQPDSYKAGAEVAHQKAIAFYENLLQSAPQSDDAVYARRVLPRLKLGIDTGQRRFYCAYDD